MSQLQDVLVFNVFREKSDMTVVVDENNLNVKCDFSQLTSTGRRSHIWELLHNGNVILASQMIDSMLSDTVYRQQLKILISQKAESLLCSFCHTPVHFAEKSVVNEKGMITLYFKHRSAGEDVDKQKKHKSCPFHTSDELHPLMAQINNGEGYWHFNTKHEIAKILSLDSKCNQDSIQIEKYIINRSENTRRKPDVSFDDVLGRKWAIELTNHWVNPQLAVEREAFFLDNNINVIWLLSPRCVEKEDSMFRFTVLGLAGASGTDDLESAHFNGYTFYQEVFTESLKAKKLLLEVLYPNFRLSKRTSEIEYDLSHEIHHFFDLKSNKSNPIPFLINKYQSYLDAKKALDEHYQILETERLKQAELAEKVKAEAKLKQDEQKRVSKEAERAFSNKKMSLCRKELSDFFDIVKKYRDTDAPYSEAGLGMAISGLSGCINTLKSLENDYGVADVLLKQKAEDALDDVNDLFDKFKGQQSESIKKRREQSLAILNREIGELKEELETAYKQLTFNIRKGFNARCKRIISRCNDFKLFDSSDNLTKLQRKAEQDITFNYASEFTILSDEFDLNTNYKELLLKAINFISIDSPNKEDEKCFFEAQFMVTDAIKNFTNTIKGESIQLEKDTMLSEPDSVILTKLVGANMTLVNHGFITKDESAYDTYLTLKKLRKVIRSHSGLASISIK